MRTNYFKAVVKAAVSTACILIFGAAAAFGQAQQVNLTAGPAGITLPDGNGVPMWGYSCGAAVATNTTPISCLPLSGPMSAAASGKLGAVAVVSGGSGYTAPPAVTISAPTGTFANPFTGVVVPPVGATATAMIANGQVVGITITSPGAGYTSAPTVTITRAASDTTGTGASATAGPAWSPVVITVPTGVTGGLQINLTNNIYSPLLTTSTGTSPVNPIPTSLVIIGQVGGGLGRGATYAASPDHSNAQANVTWPIANTGAAAMPPNQGPRVQSLATESAASLAGSTTATPTALTWTNLRPGTYLLESGTHPSIQVPMGLYGILVVTAAPTATAAGTAYGTAGTATSVSYGAEVPLEFSEIDPVQNRAVNAAVNTAGFSETANFLRLPMSVVGNVGVINGGSGYSPSPSVTITAAPGDTGTGATAVATVTNGVITSITVTNAGSGYGVTPSVAIADTTGTGAVAGAALGANSIAYCGGTVAAGAPVGATGGPAACYPPAVNYTPFYFLINGVAFDKTNAAASLFPVSQGANTGLAVGTVLVRMVNAGSRMHVPSIVGSFTQGFNLGGGSTALTAVPGFSLVAEDGNVVPQFLAAPRVQTDVFMAAGKTFDVMINVPLPVNGGTVPPSLAVYDRELSLSGNSSTRDAGMLAYISVNGAMLPVAQGSGVFAAAMANQDTYNSVVAGQTLTVSDVSKGVIANDVSVYGVQLITPPANGTVVLNANGTFTYTPNAAWSGDSFVYAANGATACQPAGTGGIFTGGACATVTLGLSSITATNKITCAPQTFNAKTAAYLAIKTPGLLLGCKDGANLPLTVVPSSAALSVGMGTVLLDSNGGFNATNTATTPGSPITFTFTVQNSQGTTGSGSATLNFPLPSNLQVTVLDGADKKTVISDYRWIIEEDKTFFVDPNCTTNNSTTGANGTANACPQATATTVPPTFGVNFHTSHMEYIAQGCTGGLNDRSCEEGQTVQGVPAACDLGNGKCDTSRTQQTAVSPGAVYLDPGCGWGTTANPAPANCGAIKAPYPKRYYISILPGDAANPFASGFAGAPDCSPAGVAAGNCGHGMGGSPITWNPITNSWNPVTILTQPSPYPPAKLSVQVFEDDFPLNGEQDAGGGVDVLATNEPGLGGFEIILWDDMGNSGDVTGQLTHDMFNQPLSNSLAGTIDPATGLDACPISPEITANIAGTGNVGTNGAGTFTPQGTQLGITGRIVTCPRFEADGTTVSPLVGQAVVANMMPGRYSVQAYPAADRIARGEEWLQTNTLDGQHAHDSFLRIGEPNYFQEYGPAGFHVSIGFANPAIINSRYAGVCGGTDLNLTAFNCTNTVTGKVTAERMSRIPDERLYSSGSRDAFYWTQCFVSLGDPDGMDFMFAKCDANGNFKFTGVPAGDWRLSVFDQWNDQLMDGLSTPVGVGPLRCANATANNTAGCNNLSVNLGDVAVQQWQANVYTRTFVDDNKDGIYQSDEIGIPLINVTVRYRDGSRANFLGTDFSGVANFNETFPLFNWYVVETDPTRYKTTGIHVVYDAGGPADGTTCGGAFPACGPAGTPYANLANTKDPYPLPTDLSVPGAIYCADATCSGHSISSGAGVPSTGNPTTSSTGRIDPPWVAAEGWQGFSGQNNFIEFGKTPYASCPPACVTTSTNTVSDTWAENGGIQGHVVYASTRPFDDPSNNVQQPWMPLVPRVTMNLYQEGFASDGVTPTLTLVDTTQTSSFDDWAQGFRSDGRPNMNCPGQGTASGGANPDLFFYTLFNQPSFLDLYNSWYNAGTQHTIPYNSQFKCYDGMHNWNQLQPAPYDGMYSFPSMLGVNPTGASAGKLNTSLAGGVGTGATFTAAPMGGTNCIICVPNPDATDPWRHLTPMLPPGKYVVEVVLPPGYELVKEEDKNILIGDNFIAPVAQEFGGLGTIFIIPDQASVASLYDPSGSGYNANNTQNPTQSFGSIQNNQIVPGFAPEPVWPCVGELRIVPDYMSIFPQAFEVAAFAGATRNLCDRKEVTLGNQSASIAKFYIYTSTHIASKYSGGITDDFTSEFDPFAPVFGEKFAPPNMPVSVKDWAGNEISRVYSDHWGQFDGLTYSTWEVNPPNPTGYAPTMMVACMNDKGPVLDTRQTIVDSTGTTVTNPTFGQMVTDPLFNPAYSQFCYELPFMPGQTQYLDTPVVPTSAFVGAGYNNPDCNYPAATPAISSVVGSDGVAGPWVRAAGSTLTITALGDQVVNNYGYSGPSATTAPFNQKTVTRHYGFGTSGTVSIGGVDATAGSSWSDSQIVLTVPNGVPSCAVQQQAQYGGSAAQCGELVITAAGGQRSIDTVMVTIGGKQPTVLSAGQTIQSAIDAAKPGDMIIVPAGTYKELLLMWKPVRLQGVGAASSIIDANTHPAGTLKIDPWRREVNCLFGLALNGQPSTGNVTVSNGSVVPGTGGTNPYDSSGTFTCPWAGVDQTTFSGGPNYPSMVVDRIPLEGILGWDATVNGNLAEQLQEPTLMGAYEGAAVTVLAKGVNIPSGSADVFGSGAEAAFPTGSTPLTGLVSPSGASVTGDPNPLCIGGAGGANQFPSNFMCNPSSIDGLGITDASQGGGGIFVHAWAHNLQVANNRVFNNAGTLSGGISIGQGESPEAYLNGTANDSDPGSCFTPVLGQTTNASFPLNTQLPYCINLSVNVHNNAITNNSSTGDELFSGTPAGAGGVSICTGADFYKFNFNWICGNLSTGDGGGVGHLGFTWNGDIEHNAFLFNQSTNPSIQTNGGGLIVMGAAPDATITINGITPECGSVTDTDCAPGLSDGTGPGLVINGNLFEGNGAEAGSGGGVRFQAVNGAEIARFPNPAAAQTGFAGGDCGSQYTSTGALNCLWYVVSVTNNIIDNNVAGWDGGGVSLEDALVVNLVNNTISSNDSTASSGVLFNTLGAPLASSQAPAPICQTTSGGTASCPQPAGLVTVHNSPQLTSSLTGPPAVAITCPAGHFQPTTPAINGTCRNFSYPLLQNNILWENRSFQIAVGGRGTGAQNQQNVVTLHNAAFGGGVGSVASSQLFTGACPSAASYWDIGVRGDTGPANHGSGATLHPTYSVLTSFAGYQANGGNNIQSNPLVASQYCNGSRVPPENGGLGYNVPAGISDAVVPNPVFNLTPTATVDEGNNWVNISWGPLSMLNPVTSTGSSNVALGNYTLMSDSPAVDYVPVAQAHPTTDFFGNQRPDPANPNAFDVGAVEFQGGGTTGSAPHLTAISPNTGARGSANLVVTLTGTNLTGTTAVNGFGGGITVNQFSVVSSTSVEVSINIASGAAPNARTVSVVTPFGTSNTVTFTVTAATVTISAPSPVLTTTTPNTSTKTGTITVSNAAAATGPLTLTAAPQVVKTAGAAASAFTITGGTCASGTVVNPGGSCTVIVQYVPAGTATATAHLSLANTGAASNPLLGPNFNAN